MSAMPRAQQIPRVLENLSAGTKDASSRKLELPPPWRLVSRDGSTSSVTSLSESMKVECLDCLAGRCGQNPRGCQCSSGDHSATISLERLTEIRRPTMIPASSVEVAPGPTMPQAKPQLFGQPSGKSSPTDFLESPRRERESFLIHRPTSSGEKDITLVRASSVKDAANDDRLATTVSCPKPFSDDLQKVIDRWSGLSRSTRRAILLLVSTSSEADSA